MPNVGLREMRQNASELVARAQQGERFVVTVSGRPAAELGPTRTPQWRTWEEISPILSLPPVTDWSQDEHQLDDSLRDPWQR